MGNSLVDAGAVMIPLDLTTMLPILLGMLGLGLVARRKL